MLKFGLIFGVRIRFSISHQHVVAPVARFLVARFSLKIFVGVVMSWTPSEDLGFKREGTYLAVFLSCWFCVFALPETEEKFICSRTFETTSLMTFGATFSLAIFVLASIYCGLTEITKVAKPSYSWSFFPCHYLYRWLAHYFKTHHILQPPL